MNYQRLLVLSLLVAAAGLPGCVTQPVRVQGDWQAKPPDGQPYDRVLIVGVSPDFNQRCAFERFFATQIQGGGTTAVMSCRAMPAEAQLTRENVEKAIAAHDIDAVLATILVASRIGAQEGGTYDTRGDAYYKATDYGYATGWYHGGYDVYGVPVVYGEFRTAPPITTVEGEVEIATRVFDTRDASLVYELDTRARDLESRAAGLAEVTGPMADRLRKDGVIR